MQLHRVAMAAAVVGLVVPLAGVAPPSACAADETRVVVVVDFGGAPDAPPRQPAGTCMPLDKNMTGAEALLARAKVLGTEPPRYESSGLLCAIDGYPKSGCGERSGAGFEYWTYWKGGDDGWAFADEGPATHDQVAGTVSGWRFQRGTGSGLTENPPRTSASFGELCPVTVAAASVDAPRTTAPATRVRSNPASAASVPHTVVTEAEVAPSTTSTTAQPIAIAKFAHDNGSPSRTLASVAAIVAFAAGAGLWIRQRGRTTSGSG